MSLKLSDTRVYEPQIRARLKPQVTVRLSTPEWYIRSMPALASDRIFCAIIATDAVHGAFAGLMNVVVGASPPIIGQSKPVIIRQSNNKTVKAYNKTVKVYNKTVKVLL